jgi:hypothetical protein
MDLYHFVKGATGGFHARAGELVNEEVARFATPLVGEWDALTILYDIDLGSVADTIAELDGSETEDVSDRPVGSTTATSIKFGQQRIRRSYHEPYEAYLLIKTQRPHDEDVLNDLNDVDGYTGSALVEGTFDILLLIGGADPDQLRDRISEVRGTLGTRGRSLACYQPPLAEGQP